MSAVCPCCGTTLASRPDPKELLSYAPIGTGARRVMVDLLVSKFGRDVATETIMRNLYSGRADGGPATGYGIIRVHAHQLRKILAPYCITVIGRAGRGSASSYRMEWAPPGYLHRTVEAA